MPSRKNPDHQRPFSNHGLTRQPIGGSRLSLYDLHARLEEFDPDDERHDTTDAEEEERSDEVHVPNRLVVSRRDPIDYDRAFAPGNDRGIKRLLDEFNGHWSHPIHKDLILVNSRMPSLDNSRP